MRLVLKLAFMVLVTLEFQECLQGGGMFDEMQFAARAYIAELRGIPRNDPTLLDAAKALLIRQYAQYDKS